MNGRYRFVAILVLLLSLFLGACQPAPSQATSAPPAAPVETAQPETEEPVAAGPKDPLVVLIDNDEGPITPANFNTFIGFWLTGWVYDGLFTRSPDLEPVPGLATEATQSEDGLTWTVKLREGVKWHDGEPFTAEDVVFSYNFLIAAGRAQALAVIEEITADDDHNLTIRLKEPAPFFLNEGLAAFFIMPEHIWKDQEPVSGELNQFQGQIGTGAFRLVEILPGEAYTFAANPDYFLGEPRVPNLIVKIVKDRTQQINQLKSGAADAVLASVQPGLVADLEQSADIRLAQGSDFFNYVFYMNASRPPFDQVEVRQAIAQAIDTNALVETVLIGQGAALPLSYYHPDLPWSTNLPHEYDPEAAKALLEETGLVDSDGDGIREYDGQPADYEILCDVNNPVEIRSTELISEWLKAVGINATQKCMDIDTVVSFIWPNFVAVPEPDYDLAIFGWSSGPQFQRGFIQYLTSGDFSGAGWANLTGTSDPDLDALVGDLITNPDPAAQEQLNQETQARFAEVLPFVPLMSPGGNFAYRPESYDGWVYMKGTGIMPVWSFLPPEAWK